MPNRVPPSPRVQSHFYSETSLSSVSDERSEVPDDLSRDSCYSRNGALSPLTDDEIRAIHDFSHNDATGYRARQRRKENRSRRKQQEREYKHLSERSGSYEMHSQIVDCYFDEENEHPAVQEGSINEGEYHVHAPLSAQASQDSIPALEGSCEHSPRVGEVNFDCDRMSIMCQDEIETPVDQVNRGTFGYYDAPMIRTPRSRQGTTAIYAYSYERDAEGDMLPIPRQGLEDATEDLVAKARVVKFVDPVEDADIRGLESDEELNSSTESVNFRLTRRSSSSLYYVSESETCDDEDEESSRLPLVSKSKFSLDSESDRPFSTSSTSASVSTSVSASASFFSSGIGLAILPPEQFAMLESTGFRRFSLDSSEGEDDLGGSPTTLTCSSPKRDEQLNDFDTANLSSSFDRFQSNINRLSAIEPLPESSFRGALLPAPSSLKPALHIKSGSTTTTTLTELPSPVDTVSTYAPHTAFQTTNRISGGKLSDDEGSQDRSRSRRQSRTRNRSYDFSPKSPKSSSNMNNDGNTNNVGSFIHLTPNEPTGASKMRPRTRLKRLFAHANLLGVGGGSTSTSAAARKAAAKC